MKRVWSHSPNDAFNFVSALRSQPKVIVIHSGTNDLDKHSNEKIVFLPNPFGIRGNFGEGKTDEQKSQTNTVF